MSGIHFDCNLLIAGIGHTTGCEALPDQLIQPELIARQRILDRDRCTCDVGRPDRFMRILHVLGRRLSPDRSDILFAVLIYNVLSGRLSRCIGDTDRICTQVGNQTDCSASLYSDALVKLLCDAHCLGC